MIGARTTTWLALVATVAAGCGGTIAAPTRYAGAIPLTLVNDGAGAVCYVRMSPAFDDEWGDDWLGAAEVIPQGAERTFSILPQSEWDVRVEDCNEEVIAERRRIDVTHPQRLSARTLTPVFGGGPPPPPPPPPGQACSMAGTWTGGGNDQAGNQWQWTLSLTQTDTALEGAFDWRASNGAAGRERVRGTIDCITHMFTVTGYVLENANGLVTGTYRGTVGGDWRSMQGSWTDGTPGNFWGQRQ